MSSGWQDLVADLVHRVQRDLESVLDGLDPRHDRNISELLGTVQVWTEQRWYARFGRPDDPAGPGFRHSRQEVAAFVSPGSAELVAYTARSWRWSSVTSPEPPAAELDRQTVSPSLHDTRTVRQRLVGVLAQGLEHVGQMAYLRGLFERRGA